jgi:hypothetical protein
MYAALMSQFNIIRSGSAGEIAGENMPPPPDSPMGCQAADTCSADGLVVSAQQRNTLEENGLASRRKAAIGINPFVKRFVPEGSIVRPLFVRGGWHRIAVVSIEFFRRLRCSAQVSGY